MYPQIYSSLIILLKSNCAIRLQQRHALLISQVCHSHNKATYPLKTEETTLSENDIVEPIFTNRNPRNLEMMGIAKKRKGWDFQYPRKDFYHRLVFECTHTHTSARVEHMSGKVILVASTKEFPISQQLYSHTDVPAAENVGRVLARRCLESGITCMIEHSHTTKKADKEDEQKQTRISEKENAFHNALEEAGIELSEPEEVKPDDIPGLPYDDPEYMAELRERQSRMNPESGDRQNRFAKHLMRHPVHRDDGL